MNDIVFKKQNGGMGRKAASEDPVSGLIMAGQGALSVMDLEGWLDSGFEELLRETGLTPAPTTEPEQSPTPEPIPITEGIAVVAKVSYYEQLKDTYGIEPVKTPGNAGEKALNAIDYHVREFFRMSPEGTLYLVVRSGNVVKAADIEALQTYAGGAIRQAGILAGSSGLLNDYQATCTELENNHQPLSLIVTYAGKGAYAASPLKKTDLTGTGQAAAGRSNISILVGCDLDPALVSRLGDFAYFGCIGNALGALSAAAVNESIAWVGKFPLGLAVPGLITGDLLKNVATGDQLLLDKNRYIYVRTHVNATDCYYNDSHTIDVVTSDYAFIENVRTMDKATRGIRTNLLPWLNAPLYVDPSTGQLDRGTVSFLETLAGRALEDMEKAGELSGYKVEIDPDQNVLATSEVEVVIKNVPVGVMRSVVVKIGFTTKLS